jgi:hypothetical protein
MALELNRVQMAGRLTKEPEIRTLPNGTTIATISIAEQQSLAESTRHKGKQGRATFSTQKRSKAQPIFYKNIFIKEWQSMSRAVCKQTTGQTKTGRNAIQPIL